MDRDERYMNEALSLAQKAVDRGEVPVGAVVVRGSEIIGKGYNKRETEKNSLAHAEIEAINEACAFIGGWRLSECELYVTLEPCPMCAGAIINSRIKRVVYGARDAKAGAFGSVINLNSYPLNHKTELCVGVCGCECADMLSDFFKVLREKSQQTQCKDIQS